MASLAEAIAGRQECPRCYHARHVGDYEKELALQSIVERIEALETTVKELSK